MFQRDQRIGAAEYDMIETSTSRGRSADGILTFIDVEEGRVPVGNVTMRLENGVTFDLVITRVSNGRVHVASNGEFPGL